MIFFSNQLKLILVVQLILDLLNNTSLYCYLQKDGVAKA